MNDLVISKLNSASKALIAAKTVLETKEVLDVATLMEVYARRKQLGEDVYAHAHYIKTMAEHKLGGMLRDGPKATGGQPYQKSTGTQGEPVETPTPTLAELGISKKTSAKARQLAGLPEKEVDAIANGKQTVTKALRAQKKELVKQEVQLPREKYRVLYADPPWSYGNTGLDDYGHAERHYPSMSIGDLCALPMQEVIDDNAVLFLWVTSPLLEACFPVIKAWGFKYKTSFIWDKVKHNFGHYNSVRHELLLVCTRGSCTPDVPTLIDSVQTIDRTKHSAKPEEFREIIQTLYPHGKRLELFARSETDGWDTFGNEVEQSTA